MTEQPIRNAINEVHKAIIRVLDGCRQKHPNSSVSPTRISLGVNPNGVSCFITERWENDFHHEMNQNRPGVRIKITDQEDSPHLNKLREALLGLYDAVPAPARYMTLTAVATHYYGGETKVEDERVFFFNNERQHCDNFVKRVVGEVDKHAVTSENQKLWAIYRTDMRDKVMIVPADDERGVAVKVRTTLTSAPDNVPEEMWGMVAVEMKTTPLAEMLAPRQPEEEPDNVYSI